MTLAFDRFTLAASTADLSELTDEITGADAVEFRMDLANRPLKQLESYSGDLPIIATNRAEWEGGDAPDEGRLHALAVAAENPAVDAVDFELRSLEKNENADAFDTVRALDVSIIASVHDFDRTPSGSQIARLLFSACQYGDVGKIAVTATTRADVLTLLSITHQFDTMGLTVATMAMGERGKHSRVVAPLYGSKIGYAPIRSAAATAPGQFDLETLRQLISALS